jgi:hypothetical protein
MKIPKKYGSYRVESCPFCKKTATAKNRQEVPVCAAHKTSNIPDIKCICNKYLELRNGKFGVYFNCSSCGNISMKKALTFNPKIEDNSFHPEKPSESKVKTSPKEITITSDQVDVYYS